MEKVTLNGTDLNVSRICLGCWQFNNGKPTVNWESQELKESKAIVDKCFETGINFFDTAEGYAGSEETLGECLKGRRRDAIVATKYGFGRGTEPYTAEQIDQTVTKSLTKMQTDYIDLLQIHFPSFIKDKDETITELKRQVALGRIRYYGVSNFGPKNLENYADLKPVSNQMGYNLLWRSVEYEVQPICKERGISILAYSPLQQGLLSGRFNSIDDIPVGRRRGKLFADVGDSPARHGLPGCEKEVFEAVNRIKSICARENINMAQASIAWLLQQDAVPVVIVGAKNPEQVVANSKIIKLSDSVVKELSDATEEVKAKVGRALDQWVDPDRCE